MTKINYNMKKMNYKIFQFLLIYINSFSRICQSRSGSTKTYDALYAFLNGKGENTDSF